MHRCYWGQEICISLDVNINYIRYDQQDITLIKDPNVTNEAATANLINMGFGF